MATEATIEANSLKKFSEALASWSGKELKAAQRSGLRLVANKTLAEMRKLIVADIPGAKLPPGYTKRTASQRRSNTSSDYEDLYRDIKPLSKGGALRVRKDGSGVTISAMQPRLLRIFTTGAKNRYTLQGYYRGSIMKHNNGAGGDYISRAGAIMAPKVGAMLDEVIIKQAKRKLKKYGYDF